MSMFDVRDGELFCEDVPLRRIADEVGTPVYVYSSAAFETQYLKFKRAFRGRQTLVAYAVKANSNLSVLKTLAALGAGADTVSEGEIRRALAAGIPADRIIFSGVGKTRSELAFAIRAGVAEINVESEPELDLLAEVAESLGARPAIAIRVNPDVAAGGHAKIATGKSENKFGVSFSEAERLYAKAASMPNVRPVAVACHIGSQILDLEPMAKAFAKMRGLVERLRASGMTVERLDLGGGVGVDYGDAGPPPEPADFGAMVAEVLEGLDIALAFEPGRLIAANSGVLLSRVIHIHERPEGRRFLVIDAAMNDLVRPAMYDAYHGIVPVSARGGGENLAYDVVGPICETGDTFARDRILPRLRADDIVAVMSAGAYGSAMSSEYNSRLLVPEVLVKGDRYAVVRPRPTYDDMLAREPMAAWL